MIFIIITSKYGSEFDARHPSGIQTGVNKKQIGMMKDEAGGKIIQEFVSLRAKQYSFKMLLYQLRMIKGLLWKTEFMNLL